MVGRMFLGIVGIVGPACTGDIAPPIAAPSTQEPASAERPGGPPPATRSDSPNAGVFAPAPAQLRKLTVSQYQNTIRDLFGPAVRAPLELEPDNEVDGFATIAASEAGVSQRGTEQLEAAARDVAHQVFANEAARLALVGCAPASVSDPCVGAFLRGFGRRAWRRPLVAAEVDAYWSVARQAATLVNDTWGGIEYAVAGMLLSPKFVFRVELGVPDPSDPGRRRYDGHEMASRLAFFIWDTTPDDALLDAAERGDLLDVSGIEREAQRLAASPRARAAAQTFFTQYLGLGALDHLEKDRKVYPLVTSTLGGSMRREAALFLDAIAFDGPDAREILTAPHTFVNRDLAKVYGLPAPSGSDFVRVTWPSASGRSGLLGLAGFLSINAHTILTSPTMRGKFIREQLMCRPVPPPPPDVMSVFDEARASGPRTMRQRFEAHTVDPACASCHRLTDPLGLTLERFDAIGAYRETDNGLPIDTSGDVDGVKVADARELALALGAHPGVAACLVSKVYRNATGHLETPGEAPTIAAAARRAVAGGFGFRALLAAVAASDGFRFAADPR